MSTRGRAKETAESENPRSAKGPEPSEVYPEPSSCDRRPENQESQRSQGDCGIRELGGIGETGRSRVPIVRRVRESEIRDMPRIDMLPARSDDMKVLVLSNLNRQVPPKRLCEKPNAVLKSERAAHKT